MVANFMRRQIRQTMTLQGYSQLQIETGINAAIDSYEQGIPHAPGQLFNVCFKVAKCAAGSPRYGRKKKFRKTYQPQ